MSAPEPEDRDDSRRRDAETQLMERLTERGKALPAGASALLGMVDFKIPLWGLLVGFTAAIWVLVGMYFQQQKTTEALNELQVIVRASNAQTAMIAGELALLKYRLDNVEKADRADAARR